MSEQPLTPQITSELRAQWWEDWDKNISMPAYKGNGIFIDHESWGEHFTRKVNEFIAAAVADARKDERIRLAGMLAEWPVPLGGTPEAVVYEVIRIIQQEPTQ